MANIPIGLQLFSVRGECEKDLPAALKAVSEIGYAGVEPWGYGGDTLEWLGHGANEVRAMLDDNGLKCCGIHLQTKALQGDNLPRTIEFNKTLGNNFLIVAADPQRMSSREGIAELARILEEAADALQPHGMFTGYHAHGFDFKEIDGQTAWDHLFGSTRQEIIMQIDIGNSVGGGGDPIAALKKFPNRARSVHLKDYGGGPESVIGEGEADWDLIFRLCETTQNTEWYVVEEGHEGGIGFDIPHRSLEALRRMGKA